MRKLILIVSGLVLAAGLNFAIAQDDEGTYIDNFGPRDSSYAQNDLLDFSDDTPAEKKSNTGMILAVLFSVSVIGGGAYFMTRKKK